jgi:methionyl-tRNA formyltransferase
VVRLGETRHGLTAHWLDQGFDTGDILLQEEFSVAPDDCWGDVEQKLLALLPSFLSHVLSRVVGSAPSRQAQDEALATYEKSFKGKHTEIDWRGPADDIRRTCLAIRPKSGGRTRIGKTPVCVWDVAGAVVPPDDTRPGEIVGFNADRQPIVRCGDGAAVVLRATLRNGVIRPGAELVARLGLKVGDRFSPKD